MSPEVRTNMRKLRPSRPSLMPGDVFVLQMVEGEYIFGRVIRVESEGGPMPVGYILVYIYSATSDDKNKIPEFDKSNLLIPPQLTNRSPWTRGYFEIVGNTTLFDSDVLRPHCFYDFVYKRYVDEKEQVLSSKIEPCGVFGIGNYRTIDDDVSKALGIPLAPD